MDPYPDYLEPSNLRDAVHLDDRRTLSNSSISLVDSVLKEIEEAGVSFRAINSYRSALAILLANLVESSRRGKPVAVSLNKNTYNKPKRYRVKGGNHGAIVASLDALENAGLIRRKAGMKDRTTGVGFRTRIAPTSKLLRLIAATSAEPPKLSRSAGAEVLVLKDSEKRLIDYEDTPATRGMRERLESLNQSLHSTRIEAPGIGVLDEEQKTLYRVFNNGSFDQGGRFYGGEWQSLTREARGEILIDGEPTVEVDYPGMHLRILYMQHADTSYIEDPYLVAGYEHWRDGFKQVLLTSLNAPSKRAAAQAIRNDMRENPSRYPDGFDVNQAIDAFLAKHAPIAGLFFTPDLGVRLQRTDSEIADTVMSRLNARSVPVLPVHDSFIVKTKDHGTLMRVMAAAFQKHTGQSALVNMALLKLPLVKARLNADPETAEAITWALQHGIDPQDL